MGCNFDYYTPVAYFYYEFMAAGGVGGGPVIMDTFLIVNYECLLEDTTILIVLRLVYNVVSMNVKYVIVMVVYVTYIYM